MEGPESDHRTIASRGMKDENQQNHQIPQVVKEYYASVGVYTLALTNIDFPQMNNHVYFDEYTQLCSHLLQDTLSIFMASNDCL